jgi:hypothetical protein
MEPVFEIIERFVEVISGITEQFAGTASSCTGRIADMVPCMPLCMDFGRCFFCLFSNWICWIGTWFMGPLACITLEWVICPCNPFVAMICFPELAGYLDNIMEPLIEVCSF